MAKKYQNPVIIIPWFDSEGMKQRSMLSFKGLVDHRLLRKVISQFCERNFRKVKKEFVDALIKANVSVFTKDPAQLKSPTTLDLDKAVEAWIQRIQDKDEPIKNESDTTSQGDIS